MIEVSWQPDPTPRRPQMILGVGDTALALYERIRPSLQSAGHNHPNNPAEKTSLSDSARLLFGETFLALKADFSELPWVNGLHYLCLARNTQHLYIPTDIKPNIPPSWLEEKLLNTAQSPSEPLSAAPAEPPSSDASATTHDILYLPTTGTLIHAHQSWPAALVRHNHLLDTWYQHLA